jgi:hypothetical protein
MSKFDMRRIELPGFCPTTASGNVANRDSLKQLQTQPGW